MASTAGTGINSGPGACTAAGAHRAHRAPDPLAARVDALGELLGLSRTRVSPAALAETGALLERVGERRRLSLDHTVVALAGATGSGKSTLFNALAGLELSATSVRRPTTAAPVACAWDPEGAAGLLDRLGIAPQDRYARRSVLDGADRATAADQRLAGLVLLDLPDHDSAMTGHRDQVDRLLQLVDVVVWVLDPEKYADAALHERYLRPLAGHADVTLLVLNQVDRLPGDAADQVLDDLRRLLDEDGLAVGEHGDAGAVVIAVSALSGVGVPDLRACLGQIVAERGSANRRLAADVDRTAGRLHSLYVGEGAVGLTDRAREEFVDRLADAVGVAGAGQAAERHWAGAAETSCGTPWGRLTAERQGGADLVARGPAVLAASRPAVDEAVRAVADDAAQGLPAPWAQAVRDAARRGGEGLPAALDAAAARAEPGEPERPRWWSVVGAVQWLLMGLALSGVVCLVAVAVDSLHASWWLPVILLAVGALGGPALAWAGRIAARGPARRYGQAAERRLRAAAADCGRARVLEPVAAELLRYREVREQYAVVAGG
ncbi:50S ribosome-binding GTPase [Streptomyces sp. H10-C2]|uniref:GTPase n=1 Tax=unclassified Streptomyces TaxID=2593676 RepID=UPI0024BA7494|nr:MULTISPECIES: GTPase [unclassified Streptomyces]MDJ0340066.1 50S ribosome-binding GTPase [Streptomyces sp. PH10-H1]MDJ0369297.1 50S ribosome-binding GTPase [Streptomyces sp. H10-C2]